jgi:acetyl esterase/lipase
MTFAAFALSASAEPGPSPDTIAAAAPGTVIKSWPIDTGVPQGYRGLHILYRSTGIAGRPAAVTAVLYYPAGRAGKPREVVAWAHPTTGISRGCAPSLLPDTGPTIHGLERFAAAGYVVVATDYIGLGTVAPHPYLIGATEAANVLDSVRAARNVAETGAGARFAVWGHSQGGHATLFSGETALSYAPELELVGLAAAAPVTDIAAMYEASSGDESGRALISMIIRSWTRVFDLPLDGIVRPEASAHFESFATDCIQTMADIDKFQKDSDALPLDFLKVDPLAYPPLRTRMDANLPGGLPRGLPVFLAQGTADNVVPPPVTQAHMERLCALGTPVAYTSIPNGIHAFAARDSAEAAAGWIADRFAGKPPPSDC